MAKRKTKSRSKSSKRALNALELAEREIEGSGSESEVEDYHRSNKNGTVVNLLKRVNGGEDDEDEEQTFEDEELDSDEALNSDDDFDILNSKFSQTIRDKKKKGEYNSDEEDENYTSIDEDELMPLSAIWDNDSAPKHSNHAQKSTENDLQLASDVSSSEGSSSESGVDETTSEDEDDSEDPFDEISEDEEDLELANVTSKLVKDTEMHIPKKLSNYGYGEANEFVLPSVTDETGTSKLSMEEMMGVVEDKHAVTNAALLKGKSMTTAVPLPQRIQQRNDRRAAYEISKDEMNKWKDIVQQNRRADHIVLGANDDNKHSESSAFTRTTEKPTSELQSKIDELLGESNLVDPQKESTFEELATAKMTPEDMKKRTAEMRLMRELMFREERKAKRLKKIKSKTYRRIKKKEAMKNKEMAGFSDESDTEHDIKRAKERMTLKHKTNSKWAKDMIKHGMTNDKETREEMEEMLRQGEKLREKIIDKQSGESDNNISDLDDDNDSEAPVVGKTGVMNMAFMKNAEARERQENKEMIAKLRNFEETGDDGIFDSDDEAKSTEDTVVLSNKGRRVYNPGDIEMKKDMKELKAQVKAEQALDESRTLVKRLSRKNIDGEEEIINVVEEKIPDDTEKDVKENKVESKKDVSNPWLDESDDENSTVKQSSKVFVVDKDSSKSAKSANKIQKAINKNKKKSGKSDNGNDELLLSEDASSKLQIVDPYGGSDDEGQAFMFKQQNVIAEAFAGDDVVAEFEDDKKRTAVDEDDQEEDVTLPGWGSWAGSGVNPKKKRKFIKKVKGVVEKDKRKDKNLKNVIINEKVNKKNLKYQSSAVPFPFENREQYERSLRMPLGQEWTSRATHQQMIKPKIITKPGQVIDPLKNPFS
ncbi:U3 small nucleolar RNA-associated protein 14 [Nakaseomyces bracarensis]|uniref:U3 small nucleolar RNA-associated protein 14 n=1 Tax=Nakaseomyces bracarensis TaxID=273131 RepID=A0ABR4NV02_9SACH